MTVPLNLQTITIIRMLSREGRGDAWQAIQTSAIKHQYWYTFLLYFSGEASRSARFPKWCPKVKPCGFWIGTSYMSCHPNNSIVSTVIYHYTMQYVYVHLSVYLCQSIKPVPWAVCVAHSALDGSHGTYCRNQPGHRLALCKALRGRPGFVEARSLLVSI